MINLAKIFKSLKTPQIGLGEERFFSAITLDGYEPHRLGKDSSGNPIILLSVEDTDRRIKPASIKLKHLSVQHNVNCRISASDKNYETQKFTIIHCQDGNSERGTIGGSTTAVAGERAEKRKQMRNLRRNWQRSSCQTMRNLWRRSRTWYACFQFRWPESLGNA